MTETALDQLMDLANDRGGIITWAHRGDLYTVTLDGTCFCRKCGPNGAPYHHSGIADTREGAAKALLNFAFNE